MISRDDFCDEESRIVFDYRKKYAETGDSKAILELVCAYHKTWTDRIRENNERIVDAIKRTDKRVIIYSTDEVGERLYSNLVKRGLDGCIAGFLDDDNENRNLLKGDYFYLIPEYRNICIYWNNLLNIGIPEERIVFAPTPFFDIIDIESYDNLQSIFFDNNNSFLLCDREKSIRLKELLVRCGCNAGFYDDVNDALPNEGPFYIVFKEETKQKLLTDGIQKDQVIHLVNIDGMIQYFDSSVVPGHIPGKKETFVDCGALDLKTSEKFLIWSDRECNRIIAFEPDPRSIDQYITKALERNQLLSDTVKVINKGVWNSEQELVFELTPDHASSHTIQEKGIAVSEKNKQEKLQVTSIDEVMNGEEVTFIKMDIEGAELEALKGARETIKKWHPTLAISAYHKPQDVLELPEYIKSIEPGYKMYLRPYHEDHTELVLYAFWNK